MKLSLSILWLAPLIVAPTPGGTGGCAEQQVEVDAETFCIESRSWDCRRKEYRGEIEDVSACISALPDTCMEAVWPLQCFPAPTVREATRCLDALARVDNVSVDANGDGAFSVSDLAECRLCER